MSKSAVGLALAGALLFGVVTIAKMVSRPGSEETASGTPSADREQIVSFWKTYHSATAIRSSGNFREATEIYEQALRLNPQHEDSLYYLGNCLLELGDYAGAAEAYGRLVEVNPESPRGHAQLGVSLSSLAPGVPLDFSRARDSFNAVLRINPEESGPYLRLGYLAFLQRQFGAALGHFETAARFGAPEGGFMAGAVHYHRGEYEESSRHFLRVLELNAREKEISGRGVLSEGDIVASGPHPRLTPLEAAGVKSLLHLYWAAARQGGYSKTIPESLRFTPPEKSLKSPLKVDKITMASGGRGAWAEMAGTRLLLVTDTEGPLKLYRSEGSRWADVTRESGLYSTSGAWDAAWGDFDGDGIPDLYIVGSGLLGKAENRLLRTVLPGPGKVRLEEVTHAAGLAGERNTTRAVFLDYDGDGRKDILEIGSQSYGVPALRLYRNRGEGRFEDVTRQAGLLLEGNAVDCAVGDISGNGFPDLVVLRWRQPLLVFENQKNGTFRDTTAQSGLSDVEGRGYSLLLLDYDRDGRQDLLVTAHAPYDSACLSLVNAGIEAGRDSHRLFRGTAQGAFQEVTRQAGLAVIQGTMQAAVLDVDQDGWPDLVLAGGGMESYRREPTLILRNREGRGFLRYAYVPGFDTPVSATGVTVLPGARPGEQYLHLGAAGLFRLRIADYGLRILDTQSSN
jgi:tetratricopeptide (TPR) repeat protein